ncbi:ComEC/Rec2 family competence protein [Oscillatoria sp. FACHB-1406]|uniref:ComEC/Rec2 family competence protein n=1 Tax=Oscillatoria sp. FACHB-1406 TaxID=2692846 RepID=UPI001685952A|nr:ComEC/Rec2 family competence protein [Oscillatoria sp. FACHB-1406]MBD2578228.1 ComEC/Rec2 family competence protein [Oscillatoria sp. FACHB-1406]
MNGTSWAILCGAYILGLFSTGILGTDLRDIPWQQWGGLAAGWTILGLLAGFIVPRFWRVGPRLPLWLAAGIVAALAVVSLQWRVPQPGENDISRLVTTPPTAVEVSGTIAEVPTLNRKQKVRFTLECDPAGIRVAARANNRIVTGKLYVTVPLLQGTGLVPGHRIRLRGQLYQPQAPTLPGAFDFQTFLARRGVFAGMAGELLGEPSRTPWGWWQIRRRIVRSQVRWLGSPRGQLLSSMVLGRAAVDLPFDIQDEFSRAGLSHVLAASGFQVSLLVGVALALTRKLGAKSRLISGLAMLFFYVALTGIQPSVMRAALMGAAVLAALTADRKLKPLGLLLAAATVLLLLNPLWVWDLGFQLSFLATLGLIVSATAITQRLDWLPPTIAGAIAVPVAASLWTLPLLIYAFSTIATYSLIVNVLATPLIALLSLGGMVSAAAALAFPPAGSAIAWLLDYPLRGLIAIVEIFNRLPGSAWAVGTITLGQLLFVYGAIVGIWLLPALQKRWLLPILAALTAVLLPLGYQHFTGVQVAILPERPLPVLLLRDKGKAVAIANPDEDSARYTLIPFLRDRGINRLDFAIAPVNPLKSGWKEVISNLKVNKLLSSVEPAKTPADEPQNITYQPLKIGQTERIGTTAIQILSVQPPVLQLQIGAQKMLFVDASLAIPSKIAPPTSPIETLLWWGKPLPTEVLKQFKPKVAIAPSFATVPPNVQRYTLTRDNPLQWTPQKGWQTLSEQD